MSESPHSIEIERETISAVIVSSERGTPEHTAEALETLTVDDFYHHAHRCLWHGILSLYRAGQPPGDPTLIIEAVRSQPLSGDAAVKAISDCLSSAGISSHLNHYASQLRAFTLRREVMSAARDALTLAADEKQTIEEMTAEVERKLYAATRKASPSSEVHVSKLARLHAERMEEARAAKGGITGIPTGLDSLDRMTGGLQPGWVVVVPGQAGMGKTALAMGGLGLAAAMAGHYVHIFSMEMPERQVTERLMCGISGLSIATQRGEMSPREWGEYTRALDVLGSLNINICDELDLTADQIRSRARRGIRQHAKGKPSVVVVDYVQQLASNHHRENEAERLAHASKMFKALAIELDCVVVLAAQVTLAASRDRRPCYLEECRGGQAIPAVADLALVPYRPSQHDESRADRDAQIYVRKFRHGNPSGLEDACFAWDGDAMRYVEA